MTSLIYIQSQHSPLMFFLLLIEVHSYCPYRIMEDNTKVLIEQKKTKDKQKANYLPEDEEKFSMSTINESTTHVTKEETPNWICQRLPKKWRQRRKRDTDNERH
ncbi:hypothetical protein C2G38_98205 [Gigaspora rosea]|uniref:Uncharacterized protein n=1 Tax=Gigaspora rosea TaxID=44941 RepID=A0A397UMV9_9GLOM|nr:hypothetical protein C2G38_98205 [Gigaspora rosea]